MHRHRRTSFLAASLLLAAQCIMGTVQTVGAEPPPGVVYAGRAAGANGEPLASGAYAMTISLYTTLTGGTAVWSETHPAVQVTNGAFSITLGNGTPPTPLALPFDQAYYLAVRVHPGGEMSPRQRLTSVPYALRAKVADQVPDQSITTEKVAPLAVTDDKIKSLSWSKITGVPGEVTAPSASGGASDKSGTAGRVWSLMGNRGSSNSEFLGTTDAQPLHIKVNNALMIALAVNGPIRMTRTLELDQSLKVGGDGEFQGGLRLGRNLRVGEDLEVLGNLGVAGTTTFSNTTDATSPSAAAFVLNGGAGIAKGLFVGGLGTFSSGLNTTNLIATGDLASSALHVSNGSPGYLATFTNTNDATGSGIKIALGKTHPLWDGSAYVFSVDPIGQAFDLPLNTIKGWVFGHDDPSVDDIINLFPSSLIVGTVCNLSNLIVEKINDGLNLPYEIGPYGTPSVDLEIVTIPALDVLPRITVMKALPTLNCGGFPTLSVPNLSFTSVTNSLTNSNEFIRFTDKDERLLGAIRAESIENWVTNYLDGNYFVNVMGAIAGVDIVGGIFGAIAEFSDLTKAYNHIGVEYMSGHGDYAEWLERVDAAEAISAGDIVGVRGGRITKDLTGAEQVLAVSHKPIVLGNMPPADKEQAGNKVAFMGQIPVKIQGPVASGDYIVARSEIPGYGIAVKPADMSAEDLRLCVGRSWETRSNAGPKMVNTVVGIVNHDFVGILQRANSRAEALEARLRTVEERIEALTTLSEGSLRQARTAAVTTR